VTRPAAGYNYAGVPRDEAGLVKFFQTVESVGANAYLGAVGAIESPDVLAAALSIHASEAEHTAALADIVAPGTDLFAPESFATPRTPAQVVAIVTRSSRRPRRRRARPRRHRRPRAPRRRRHRCLACPTRAAASRRAAGATAVASSPKRTRAQQAAASRPGGFRAAGSLRACPLPGHRVLSVERQSRIMCDTRLMKIVGLTCAAVDI